MAFGILDNRGAPKPGVALNSNLKGDETLSSSANLSPEVEKAISENKNENLGMVVTVLLVTFILLTGTYIVGFSAVVQNDLYQNKKVDEMLLPLLQAQLIINDNNKDIGIFRLDEKMKAFGHCMKTQSYRSYSDCSDYLE